jgi:hypothetical protein
MHHGFGCTHVLGVVILVFLLLCIWDTPYWMMILAGLGRQDTEGKGTWYRVRIVFSCGWESDLME